MMAINGTSTIAWPTATIRPAHLLCVPFEMTTAVTGPGIMTPLADMPMTHSMNNGSVDGAVVLIDRTRYPLRVKGNAPGLDRTPDGLGQRLQLSHQPGEVRGRQGLEAVHQCFLRVRVYLDQQPVGPRRY